MYLYKGATTYPAIPQVQVYYTHLYKKKTIRTHMLYTWLPKRMCAAKVHLA
jgi:hypothetical protein